MRRTLLVSLITVASGFLLAATRAPAPAEACSLLSKDDATAAIGEAAKGPKAKGPLKDGAGSTVSSCEYTGSGYHRVQLVVTYPPAASMGMYKGMICDKKKNDGLAGMGDVACWYDDKHEELHVIKGAAFLSMEINRSGSPTDAIIAVMKKALAKLK